MIQIKNLNFSYKKKKLIFENTSLNIFNGIYGLLGENGVGKSTFLHILSGLLHSSKEEVSIYLKDPASRNTMLMSKLYILPEEIQESTLTLEKYASLHGVFYPNYNGKRLDEYAKKFNISTNISIKDMSLGERKKVWLTFAFALDTPILLLDEPTNGLDIPSKAQFRKVLASLDTDNKCVIISTHQVRDLENMLDSIIILDRQGVIVNNSIDEITDKLYFSYDLKIPPEAIYSEPILQGYSSVQRNTNNMESTFNIESLFTAAILNKQLIKQILKNETI